MSTFKPALVVIDYETALLTGEASVEFYRDDFRIDSMAWSYRDANNEIKSGFVEGEDRIAKILERLVDDGVPIWAHNVPFEMGCTMCRFPELEKKMRWGGDTMRLAQNFDNGGRDYQREEVPLTFEEELDKLMTEAEGEEYEREETTYKKGLSLVACTNRILPRKHHGHKKEAHDWIRENVKECGAKGRVGKFLNRLPYPIMKRYNIGDTETTLALYEFITDHFSGIGYDYRMDHALYMNSVRMIVVAKIGGAEVRREALAETVALLEQEVIDIEQAFLKKFDTQIQQLEAKRLEEWCGGCRTDAGQLKRRNAAIADRELIDPYKRDPDNNKWDKNVRFNVGSNKQLTRIFVGALGMKPVFLTDKGSPSFKSCFLSQWGEGGLILKTRRERLLVLQQAKSLYELSEYDGRWHLDLKACGCSTGRYSGGTSVG